MKIPLLLALPVLGLIGCASTPAVTAPTSTPAATAIIYDLSSNFALVHFSAGAPVPDMAEENGSAVMKPTWAAFKAFEEVP